MDYYRTEDRNRYYNVKNYLLDDENINNVPNANTCNDTTSQGSTFDVRNLSVVGSDSDSYDERPVTPEDENKSISSGSIKETRC